jgi:hypothetical protein
MIERHRSKGFIFANWGKWHPAKLGRFKGFVVAKPGVKHTVRERPPPEKLYHKFIIAETQRLGIKLDPIPQLFAFNERWEQYVEQQIAHKTLTDKFRKTHGHPIDEYTMRKPGQRGPGKQRGVNTVTSQRRLDRAHENYWGKKSSTKSD